MSERDVIVVRDANVNNLKGLSCEIPRGKITVVCGLSGAGKSSLVFDTLGKEVELRRAIFAGESLHLRSRAEISGLPPAVMFHGGGRVFKRATVATETGIYPLLTELALHQGYSLCTFCGGEIRSSSPAEIIKTLLESYRDREIEVDAPIDLPPSAIQPMLEILLSKGFVRIRIDGERKSIEGILEGSNAAILNQASTLSIPIDRFKVTQETESRLRESLRIAADIQEAKVLVSFAEGDPPLQLDFPLRPECAKCHRRYTRMTFESFVFSRPSGRCLRCGGKGTKEGGTCQECDGTRLNLEARERRLADASILQILSLSLAELIPRWKLLGDSLSLSTAGPRKDLVLKCVREVETRLTHAVELGLGYLQLKRSMSSLSSGERNRTRLVRPLSSGVEGGLYLLNEPLWGLHPADQEKILSIFAALAKTGATIVQIEHEAKAIRAADNILELGPGSGPNGGEVILSGRPEALESGITPTSNALRFPNASAKKNLSKRVSFISLSKVSRNNLKHINARFPVHSLTLVRGVSGSGKSSLVLDVLPSAVRAVLAARGKVENVDFKKLGLESLSGTEEIRRVIDLPQSIRRSNSKGSVAALLGIMSPLQELFSKTVAARALGLEASQIKPSADNTHEVRYRGFNIRELLELTVGEAGKLLARFPRVTKQLQRATELGLSYLVLSETSSSLSYGEIQRLRLSRVMSDKPGSLIVLDEPTGGLHLSERHLVYATLRELVSAGSTVVAVEHADEMAMYADHVIELGPGAGDEGGEIVRTH